MKNIITICSLLVLGLFLTSNVQGAAVIAFDAESHGYTTNTLTHTKAHTVAGNVLIVETLGSLGSVSNVTYAGQVLSQADSTYTFPNGYTHQVWVITNPAIGTNDIVVSSPIAQHLFVVGVSYSGVDTTNPLESVTHFSSGPVDEFNTSVTPSQSDSLVVLAAASTGGIRVFNDGVLRGNDGATSFISDSNAATIAGQSVQLDSERTATTGLAERSHFMLVLLPSGATPPPSTNITGYYIFPIIGQSNTYSGEPEAGDTTPNPTLDATDPKIFQWGRWDGENNQVIVAEEPLDHIGYQGQRPPADKVAWAMTFAKKFIHDGNLPADKAILLVPVGEGGSGFANNKWNPGDANYLDTVNRVNAALSTNTGCAVVCSNELKGFLWHQGESDSGNSTSAANHNSALLAMIDGFRSTYGEIPFVAGGMMESWVNDGSSYVPYRQQVQDNLQNLPTNRAYTGYADSSGLTTSSISTNDNHFSSYSMRGQVQDFSDSATLGMAGRYYDAYIQALSNTGTPTLTPTVEIWVDSDGLGCTKITTLNGAINSESVSCP